MQVKILDKTCRLLALFPVHGPSIALSELARRSEIPKSTVHRIVAALCEAEFLLQDPIDDRYRLGPLAVRLGRRALADIDLRRSAMPTLHALARECGETVLLMGLDPERDDVVCLEQIESRQGIRLVREVGARLPLHAGGASKAILAFLEDATIERVLSKTLPRVARGTKTDAAHLRADLAQVRRQGFARSVEETCEGAAGYAAPIFDDRGKVCGSVSIAGPISRIDAPGSSSLPRMVVEAGRSISRAIGGEGGATETLPVPGDTEIRGAPASETEVENRP